MISKNKTNNYPNHSRSEAINHVSESDDDEIQPAATSLPSRGYTHLMTPGLQQLTYCLGAIKM